MPPQFLTDPRITYMGLREPESPMDIFTRFAQLRQIAEASRFNRLREQEANLRLEELRRQAAEGTALRGAMAAGVQRAPQVSGVLVNPPTPALEFNRQAALSAMAGGAAAYRVPEFEAEFGAQDAARQKAALEQAEQLSKLDDAAFKRVKDFTAHVSNEIARLMAIPPQYRPQAWPTLRAQQPEQIRQMLPEEYPGDQWVDMQAAGSETAKQVVELEQKRRGQVGSETDKYVSDWLATNKLPDTPENRQKARNDYINKTKIEPARIRLEVLGETRGIPVTDKRTGETAYMSWAEYNRARKAEPSRYTAPQYDPETQMRVSAWRDLAKGTTRNQVTSYDTFLRHTGDLWDAVDTFTRTGSPWLNRPLNALRREGGGNPQIQAFLAKLDPVQKEFQSFLLNNRALYEDDRRVAQEMLNENLTPAQMRAVLSSMAHTGDARLQALNESFKRATGEDIPALYSEPARGVLGKVGVAQPGAAQPGGTVRMRAPNGQERDVPADQVEHYKARGAVVVGPKP